MIEKYGSGIKRVRQYMRETRAKEPIFESGAGLFKVTLFPIETMFEGVSEGVNEGVNEGVSEGVNEGVNRLYSYITNHPGERVPSLSASLGTAQKNVERWLKELRTKGKIKYHGAPKTGGYYPTHKD